MVLSSVVEPGPLSVVVVVGADEVPLGEVVGMPEVGEPEVEVPSVSVPLPSPDESESQAAESRRKDESTRSFITKQGNNLRRAPCVRRSTRFTPNRRRAW